MKRKYTRYSRKSKIKSISLLIVFFLVSVFTITTALLLNSNRSQDVRSRAAENTSSSSRTLIFSLDQGWGNGIIEKQDMKAVDRIIASLQQIQKKHIVYVLLTPMNMNKTKISAVLDRLVAANLPFVFDVYTSDGLTIGSASTFNEPYDTTHGNILSISQLQEYKTQYPSHFAGIRIMETFSLDHTIRICRLPASDPDSHPEWCLSRWEMPSGNFYVESLAKNYLNFAKQHNMFAFWTELYWYQFNPTDTFQKSYEDNLKTLLSSNGKPYMNTLTFGYGNNDHKNKQSWTNSQTWYRLTTWQQPIQALVSYGTKGIGLSDQSWACGNEQTCPPAELVKWADDAWSKGANLVQFEPSWYFWKLPRGVIGQTANYTTDPAWEKRGCPTDNFYYIASALGVSVVPCDAPTPTPTKVPTATSKPTKTPTPASLNPPVISAKCNGDGSATVAWTVSKDATSYFLRINDTSDGTFNPAICTTSTTAPPAPYQYDRCIEAYTGGVAYVLKPVHSGAIYNAWVHGAKGTTLGAQSNVVTFSCVQ